VADATRNGDGDGGLGTGRGRGTAPQGEVRQRYSAPVRPSWSRGPDMPRRGTARSHRPAGAGEQESFGQPRWAVNRPNSPVPDTGNLRPLVSGTATAGAGFVAGDPAGEGGPRPRRLPSKLPAAGLDRAICCLPSRSPAPKFTGSGLRLGYRQIIRAIRTGPLGILFIPNSTLLFTLLLNLPIHPLRRKTYT